MEIDLKWLKMLFMLVEHFYYKFLLFYEDAGRKLSSSLLLSIQIISFCNHGHFIRLKFPIWWAFGELAQLKRNKDVSNPFSTVRSESQPPRPPTRSPAVWRESAQSSKFYGGGRTRQYPFVLRGGTDSQPAAPRRAPSFESAQIASLQFACEDNRSMRAARITKILVAAPSTQSH